MTDKIHTPWGVSDHVSHYGEGIEFHSTPSHGGFRVVDLVLNDQIPVAWRKIAEDGRGWYEEDCNWCVVALTFPERFKPEEVELAQRTFDGWIKPKLVPTEQIEMLLFKTA